MVIKKSSPITDVQLGEYVVYPNGVGDTWDPTWARDGSLYFPGNDGSGWNQACTGNLFFNRAVGEDFRALEGQTVNGMAEYGGWAKEGPDGCTWKSSGCISVDGILYLALARHQYGTKSGDPARRQTARRASIIKSMDGGQSWARPAQENYDRPMFPGSRFATPYFIHYGRDGADPAVDNADRYIYAFSNNGFWCNGDNYILGRVARGKIARLDPADWQFYTGGDGILAESWTGQMNEAALLIDNPLKCGETGATYLPSIGRYILVAWYYPGDPNVDTDETHFIYYESPKPWGVWTQVREGVIHPEGWYCPRVLAKWQNAYKDELDTVLVTGGDYYEPQKYYCFTAVPLKLKTDGRYPPPLQMPVPLIVDDGDTGEGLGRVCYHGSWEVSAAREKALHGREHFSSRAGDFLAISFTGSRLKWYTSKENSLGIAAVSIDGGDETLVDLYTFAVVPLYGRLVFDSGPLNPGTHTFNVRVIGQKNEKSSGTVIFHDRVEITNTP